MANTKISALTSGNPAQNSDLIPIERGGVNYSITVGSIAPTMGVPGYFFPSPDSVFDPVVGTDVNPANSLNNNTQYKQFYLPFNITITRYRFQVDAGTNTSPFFYAGLFDSTGTLVFDIGKIDVSLGVGQYGPGATFDPGTVFFDASRAAKSSIYLAAGWYWYGWGASTASGTIQMPSMSHTALWGEQINVDTTGLPGSLNRWGHSGSFDISAGHLPTSISTFGGGTTDAPAITFFA